MSGESYIQPIDDDNEYEDVDESLHSKLISSVSRRKGNRIRGEAHIRKASTLSLAQPEKNVSFVQLLKKASKSKAKGLKRLKTAIDNKPIPKPVAKAELVRAEREVDYKDVKQDVSKWQGIVNANRKAPTIHFPIERDTLATKASASDFVKRTGKKTTDLEQQINAALQANSDYVPDDDTGLTPKETKIIEKLSAEEAMERLGELRRQRIRLSEQLKRYRREKKIKSKGFRRLKTKYRLEAKMAEVNSETIGDIMRKRRIEERATLRHRRTGKWDRKLRLYAKHDEAARTALEEKLKMNRKLTKKPDEEEQKEADQTEEQPMDVANAEDNEEAEEDTEEWQTTKKGFKSIFSRPTEKQIGEPISDSDTDDDENDDQDMDLEEEPETVKTITFAPCPQISLKTNRKPVLKPDKFFSATSSNPNFGAAIEDISEAFADDDVVQDFAREIEEAEQKKNKPEVKNLGWGSWFGPGMTPKEEEPTKTKIPVNKIPQVIFSTEKNKKLAEHQIRDIPFGFTSTEQYERTLRQPIGRDFNTEASFKKLIEPRVTKRLGAPIAPMSREVVDPDDYNEEPKEILKL